MDVKETLTRWSRAYMEPSLFYVPAKKNDEYYTVTIIPRFNYFDVYEEKIKERATFLEVYKETTTNTGSSFSQWGMQTMQNAYQKTSNAIGKAIKKNKVKLKYGTFVYLINSKDTKSK